MSSGSKLALSITTVYSFLCTGVDETPAIEAIPAVDLVPANHVVAVAATGIDAEIDGFFPARAVDCLPHIGVIRCTDRLPIEAGDGIGISASGQQQHAENKAHRCLECRIHAGSIRPPDLDV